ncbi:zinc-dependent metalloprotease [Butyricimonas synergistica]|uniref:zinc-dependent metalloprotease n=1 Tax=Butyricimonas synergistica TaxID=544644 RepID=UPI0003652E32|nr:zinc-dependent metalloprotease [Butyricimonas synergistica]
MKRIIYLVWVSLFLFGFCNQLMARKKKQESRKVEQQTPYDKLFKGKTMKTARGIMTVHKWKDKVYVEFPVNLLGKDMMLVSSIEDISDNGEGVVGQFAGYSLPLRFTRLDSFLHARISLIDKPLNNSTRRNIDEAIEQANAGGIYAMFKVLAFTPDSSAIVVDMTSLFMEYSPYTTPFAPYAANSFYGYIAREHNFKKECSFLKDVKAFDNNIAVQCELGFVENQYLFGAFKITPGDVKVSVTVNKILLQLPEKPMKPRFADPRLGVAFTRVSHFPDEKKPLEQTHYTKRWRLEPTDVAAYNRGESVEPRKPIVFYMDSLMPGAWKKYVKEGVEAWNEAFEAIGFKNVVRVVDFPSDDPDFDANNIKYSTIRYAPLWLDMQSSMHIDPRTGEILNASLYLYDGMVSGLQNDRKLTTMAADPGVRRAFLPEEMVGDLIRTTVMRETGINLGLLYNAGASGAYPVDSLRSPAFTREYGLSPSIMDNVPCNYIAQPGDPERGVRMTPKGLGEYDYYAIGWLYKPIFQANTPWDELVTLDSWIKAGRGNPNLRYGKMPYYYYDPTSFAGDLGDDHLKSLQYAVNNLKLSLRYFFEWYADEDTDTRKRALMYNALGYQLRKRINDLSVNLGGFYQQEAFSDENVPAYVVVPRATQKAALKYMVELAKDLSWLDNKDVERKLEIRNSMEDQIRGFILGTLTFRIKYVALGAEKGGDYSVKEYMDDIYNAVWEGTIKNRPLKKYEMDLQRDFLGSVVASSTITTTAGNFTPRKGLVESELSELPGIDRREVERMMRNSYWFPEKVLTGERNGFSPNTRVIMPGNCVPVDHYFNMLFRVRDLLNTAVAKSSGDTRLHYEYLLYKIKKMLDNK